MLIRRDGGPLELVSVHGGPAPGTTENFWSFNSPPALNAAGTIAFHGTLDHPNFEYGIWRKELGGDLELVLREGTQAPGTQAGVVFDVLNAPALNAEGRLVFGARLRGAGVDASNDFGIWMEDIATGEFLLVAREGDLFDVGGEMRTIASLSFLQGTGDDGGRRLGLNNLGQLVFSASFTDDSRGLFRAQLAAEPPVGTPEPATLLLLSAGLLAAATRSRKPARLRR